jgi:hypothetical protein
VGPRGGLDAVVKRQIPSPWRDSNPRSSRPYSSAIPLRYSGHSAGGVDPVNVSAVHRLQSFDILATFIRSLFGSHENMCRRRIFCG